MAVYIGIDFACLMIGMMIGSAKGFTGLGIILGLILGPLGVLMLAVMKSTPEVQAKRELAVAAARTQLQQQRPDSRA
jgi:F0F1-type ATP synthase assembly protein I